MPGRATWIKYCPMQFPLSKKGSSRTSLTIVSYSSITLRWCGPFIQKNNKNGKTKTVVWDAIRTAMKLEKKIWTAEIELYRWVMSNGPYGYRKMQKRSVCFWIFIILFFVFFSASVFWFFWNLQISLIFFFWWWFPLFLFNFAHKILPGPPL